MLSQAITLHLSMLIHEPNANVTNFKRTLKTNIIQSLYTQFYLRLFTKQNGLKKTKQVFIFMSTLAYQCYNSLILVHERKRMRMNLFF